MVVNKKKNKLNIRKSKTDDNIIMSVRIVNSADLES